MKISLSPESKIVLLKRFKSFLWRTSAIVVIMGLDFAAQNLSLFNLPMSVVVLIGLVLGELTKFIRVNLPAMKAKKVVEMPIAPAGVEAPPCAGCTDTK